MSEIPDLSGRPGDLLIAVRLGGQPYTMSEVDYWHSPQSTGGDRWRVVWRDGTETALPCYTTSVDESLRLPIPGEHWLQIEIGAISSAYYKPAIRDHGVPIPDGDGPMALSVQERTARAICAAWWSWMDREERNSNAG